MIYTVKLDFSVDEDAIRTDKEVEEFVKEIFDYTYCSAFNIEVLDAVLETSD